MHIGVKFITWSRETCRLAKWTVILDRVRDHSVTWSPFFITTQVDIHSCCIVYILRFAGIMPPSYWLYLSSRGMWLSNHNVHYILNVYLQIDICIIIVLITWSAHACLSLSVSVCVYVCVYMNLYLCVCVCDIRHCDCLCTFTLLLACYSKDFFFSCCSSWCNTHYFILLIYDILQYYITIWYTDICLWYYLSYH